MFNKSLVQKYQLDNPYQTVKDGKWTLTVFDTMSHAVSADLNGDSTMDLNDQWGMVWQSTISGMSSITEPAKYLPRSMILELPYLQIRHRPLYRSLRLDTVHDEERRCLQIGTVEEGLNVFHGGRSSSIPR